MTANQKQALKMMAKDNTGALLVKDHGWVFPQHIRDSETVAVAVINRLNKDI